MYFSAYISTYLRVNIVCIWTGSSYESIHRHSEEVGDESGGDIRQS